MFKLFMPSSLVFALLGFCLTSIIVDLSAVDNEQLPPLWDESELDAASQSAGLYRILSEIHLDDNNKDSYLVEEWLDGPGQVFRMDVLNLHGDTMATSGLATTSGAKKTLLARTATSERYLFEPFQCSPFENLNFALGPNLGNKFPRDGHQLALAGVGALWLFATQESSESGAEPTVFKAAKLPPSDGTLKNKRTRSRTMRTFDMFEVPERTSEFPYKIRFYFLPNEWRLPDGKFNHQALVSVQLVDPSPGPTRIRLNARILEIDVHLRSLPGVTSNLFELPLGYGCTRHGLEEVTVRNVYEPPGDCFDGIEPQRPHVCDIEVVSYLPREPSDDLDKWAVHTSSLRLASGQLLGRSYLTLEMRDFATPEGATSAPKRSTLRRSKRIWDLGPAKLEGGEYSERYDNDLPPPMYFELSEHLHVCRAYGNAHLNELPSLEFSLNSQVAAIGESTSGPRVEATSSEPIKRLVGLSLIDERSMRELFQDTTGFHLVRELAAPWPRYREMHHEKRIDRLELRDHSGQLGWSGPASLVRRWYTPETRPLESETGRVVPAEAREVRLTIYLFESTVYKQQIGRLQLTMSQGLQVDEAYLHRDLDLGPCLARQPSDNLMLHTPLIKADSLTFRLTYPLDVPGTQVLALRSDYRDQIYGKFLQIIGDKLLSAGEHPLEFHLMQLGELQVDVESNLIAVSGRLHRWPEAFNYIKWPPARLRESKANQQLVLMMSELKRTSEQCAQSCSHYACPLFVYDQIGNRCHIYHRAMSSGTRRMQKREQQREEETVGQPLSAQKCDTYCAVYERRLDAATVGRAATPRHMVERMNEWIARELGNGTRDGCDDLPLPFAVRSNPLALELQLLRSQDRVSDAAESEQEERALVLVPSSLHVGSDLRAKLSLFFGQPGDDFQREYGDENKLTIEAQFEILFKSRKFKAENFHRLPDNDKGESWFPLEEASSVDNQQECELLCREHDCRSYSYCQLTGKCLVSRLHTQSAIEAASEEAVFCMLLAREYLSKFDKFENQIRAKELSCQADAGAIKSRLHLQLDSARDCAISCMDAQEFSCRSFVMCPNPSGQFECHLFGERSPPTTNGLARVGAAPVQTSDPPATSELMCDLYQRSFLVDYKQFYGKQLNAAKPSGQSIKLLRGLGAEDCASACSQAIDNEENQQEDCVAFHVCLNSPGQGKRHQLLCGLLMRALSGEHQSVSSISPTTLLQDEANCSAFVPYNSGRPARSTNGTNRANHVHPLDGEQQEGKLTHGSHSVALSLLVILMGLATGYAITWLIALQNLVTYPALLVQSMRSGV